MRWGSGHLVGKVTRWEFDSFGYVLHMTTADGTEVSVQEGAILARASDNLIQSARVALPWPGLSTAVSFPCIMRLDKADGITQGNVVLVNSGCFCLRSGHGLEHHLGLRFLALPPRAGSALQEVHVPRCLSLGPFCSVP